nr:hypothetical protein [uncultured Cohaesibacter sp.]
MQQDRFAVFLWGLCDEGRVSAAAVCFCILISECLKGLSIQSLFDSLSFQSGEVVRFQMFKDDAIQLPGLPRAGFDRGGGKIMSFLWQGRGG